jgi:hypothetical protein
LEGSGCDLILRYYLGIFLEELRKITKKFSQDSWLVSGPRLEPGPPEYEAELLTIQPQRWSQNFRPVIIIIAVSCKHRFKHAYFLDC